MIKVYTLFFFLLFSIIGRSEALVDIDTVINPLDTIEVSLVKEGILLPQQVHKFITDLENFYKETEGGTPFDSYKITEDDANVLLEQVAGESQANQYTSEQIVSNFIELSSRAFSKLESKKGEANQLHVYSYKSNKLNPASTIPDRNMLSVALLRDKEYVASFQINLLLINGQIKLLHVQ